MSEQCILCQKQSKLDLADVIKQRKNILLRLPLRDPAYEYSSPIIGTFFMTLLQAAIFGFGNMPHGRRPSCTLVIDEFQNFVTEDNEKFFSEGRKYRVKQILAHQYMSQLDRDGLTTMKQAATSAYTIVAFRTNKDDSGVLAPAFSGLQRKATDIIIDVLPLLEKHKSAMVKEFYWHTVKPLETAARLRETTERWTTGEGRYKTKHEEVILPSYTFGFGVVSFAPELVLSTLQTLNNALYYSQKEEQVNESRFERFWQDFLTLNEAVAYDEVEDEENKQKIQELGRQIRELEKIQRGDRLLSAEQVHKITQDAVVYAAKFEKEYNIPDPFNLADDEPVSSLEAKVRRYISGFPFEREELGEAIAERVSEIASRLSALCRERIERFKALIKQHGMADEEWKRVAFTYGLKYGSAYDYDYPKNFFNENIGFVKRFFMPQYIESGEMYFRESLEYTNLSQEGRLLKYVQSHIEWEERKSREDASSRIKELEEERKSISPTRKVENARIVELKELVRQVIAVLIEQPLTADNASFSAAEIAHSVQQQPNRQAYVKLAATMVQMTTRDLADTFVPVSWQEANERRNSIIKQTKEKYCRGRATVEQEIAAVYQRGEDDTEPPPTAPTPAKLPKQPPSGGRSGTQPDLFDRLDADESAT